MNFMLFFLYSLNLISNTLHYQNKIDGEIQVQIMAGRKN